MSAFYVGQRVRISKCYNRDLQHFLGSETTIIGVAWDEWELALKLKSAPWGIVTAPSSCLEPILPAGLESLDRINELYEPEPEVIRV